MFIWKDIQGGQCTTVDVDAKLLTARKRVHHGRDSGDIY